MATICTDAVTRPAGSTWTVQILVWLAMTAALVTAAYFFVDQPMMAFISSCELGRYRFLRWLTRPPEVFVVLSPVVFVAALVRRWFSPWTWSEKVAVAAALSTMATALCVLILKWTLGRSEDGFHLFEFNPKFLAFPSGHTACTISVTAVAGVALPRWRLCWWALPAIVGGTLIALNFHYLGDIFGGAFVGWAIGGTAARSFGLQPTSRTTPSHPRAFGCSQALILPPAGGTRAGAAIVP